MITRRKISIVVASALFGAMLSVSNVVLPAEPGGRTRSMPEVSVECTYSTNKKTSWCHVGDDGTDSWWKCAKQRNGTWKCSEVKKPNSNLQKGAVPPDLRATVVKNAQALKTSRKTKSP